MAALRKFAFGALCVPLMLLLTGFFWGSGVNTYSVVGYSGIDCSGSTDSASGLQNAINAIPDNSTIFFPTNCSLRIGSTVTITDRVGLLFTSGLRQQNGASAPSFVWGGANNGVMFDFEHSDHPTVAGFLFNTDTTGGRTVGNYLKFDGTTGGTHIGTAAEVAWNNFLSPSQSNASFVAVNISPTATTNHENYWVHDNTVTCDAGQQSTLRAVDGVVTSGSTTVTSATAGFSSGPDAGKRVRLSYPGAQGGFLWDTTISSVTNSTTIVLAAAPAWVAGYIGSSPLANVQINVGTNYGVGVRQGANQNAKHTRIWENQVTGCDIQVSVNGGSVDVRHLGGGFGGTGLLVQGNTTDAISIEQVENEGNLRDLDLRGGVAPFTVIGQRIANANQLADGFLKLGGNVTLIGSGSVSSTNGSGLGSANNAHAMLIGEQGTATTGGASGSPVFLMSINNNFGVSQALVGYLAAGTTGASASAGDPLYNYGYASLYDNFGSTPYGVIYAGQADYSGSTNLLQMNFKNLPTSSGVCSGNPGRLWSNSGVLTVC